MICDNSENSLHMRVGHEGPKRLNRAGSPGCSGSVSRAQHDLWFMGTFGGWPAANSKHSCICQVPERKRSSK